MNGERTERLVYAHLSAEAEDKVAIIQFIGEQGDRGRWNRKPVLWNLGMTRALWEKLGKPDAVTVTVKA